MEKLILFKKSLTRRHGGHGEHRGRMIFLKRVHVEARKCGEELRNMEFF
jgi:hypothetical protein